MLFEIRNYHFNPDLFDEYKEWARTSATPYLLANLDLVGFWVKSDIESEVNGRPLDDLGSANVTWIIRWENIEQRNAQFPQVLSSPEWNEIFSHVPGGPQSYLRTEAKFSTEL